jgi:hypothetical protein
MSDQKRTVQVLGREALLFARPAVPLDDPELPEIQSDYDFLFYQDWLKAFYRLLIQNVDFAEKNYDIEENSRLGQIIQSNVQARTLLS